MISFCARLVVILFLTVTAGCDRRTDDPQVRAAAARQAHLAKVWTLPPFQANASEQFWTLRNGYLVLWEPDDTVPRQVPGRALLSLRCDPARGLVVEPDIVVQQDVPLPYPPFDTLTLEGGSVRAHTPMKRAGNGYTTWAAGDFALSRGQIESLLHAPFFVIRPLYLGERGADWEDPDLGERYLAPPMEIVSAFLGGCRAS